MIWHLVSHWVTGHWLIAVVVAVVALVLCVPGVGLPLLRAMFTTRLGLVATTLALALGLGSWYGSSQYAVGVHDTEAHAKAQTDAANLAVDKANRAAESARTDAANRLAAAYEKGKADAHASVAGVLDDVAAGRYVLRDHFRCPVHQAGAAPADSSPASSPESATWGFSGADVQSFIRLAGDADDVSADLALCKATLAADRQVMP